MAGRPSRLDVLTVEVVQGQDQSRRSAAPIPDPPYDGATAWSHRGHALVDRR